MDARHPWLRLVAWPYALGTLAVVVLWWLVGDTRWTSLLNLMTFWWLLPSILLFVLAAVLRDRRALLLLCMPVVAWGWAYGSAFLPDGSAGRSDLRVVSFNTYVFVDGVDHVLDLVEATDPDVLLLQEVFPADEEELTARLSERLPYVHVDQTPQVGGVGVWSRHPVTDTARVPVATSHSRSSSVVTLSIDGRAVQVASVHLISPCPDCGRSVLERLELEDAVRAAEIGAVLDALDPELPAVVGGDLNSNERSTAYRELVASGFVDPQRAVGSGMGFTWPADGMLWPVLRIDWVLARGLEPVAAAVGDARGSDHRPVIADLAWQDGAA